MVNNFTDREGYYLRIVTNEVAKQIGFALDAWDCFRANMATDSVKASADIHHMLNHAAIIANLIKPNVKSIKARNRNVNGLTKKCKEQARIRDRFFSKALNLGKPEPLYLKKNVRNGIEHFDERIDEWYCGIPEGASLVWGYIEVSKGNMIQKDGKRFKCRRHLNQETKTLTIFDDDINLELLAKDLQLLKSMIDALSTKL